MRAATRGVLPGEPGMLAVPKGHCRGCGVAVPRGRRNWCGDECVERHLVRNNPAHARQRVLERDRGICSGCGRDCVALELSVQTYATTYGEGIARADEIRLWSRRRRLERWFSRLGLGSLFRSLWQADHIRPVVEGGGGCGLENLRTLCVPCHKHATRELAARRAAERRKGGR